MRRWVYRAFLVAIVVLVIVLGRRVPACDGPAVPSTAAVPSTTAVPSTPHDQGLPRMARDTMTTAAEPAAIDLQRLVLQPFALGPLKSETLTVSVGSCDSVTFRAFSVGGAAEMVIVDPGGRRVSTDGREPRGSFEEIVDAGEGVVVWRVPSPVPGEWTVELRARTALQGGFFSATEHGGAEVDASVSALDSLPVLPGSVSRLDVDVRWKGNAVLGAVASATVASPDRKTRRDVALHDDGVHGDRVAQDGVYSAELVEAADGGTYTVSVWVQGKHGRAVINRRTTTHYEVVTRPDIELPPGGVTIEPTGVDSVYRVDVRFTNVGTGPATRVRLWYEDAATGLVFGDPIVAKIDPGDWVTVSEELRRETYHRDSLRVRVSIDVTDGGEAELGNNRGAAAYPIASARWLR